MRKLTTLIAVLALAVPGISLAASASTKKVSIGGTIHSAIVGASAHGAQIAGAAKDRSLGQIAILFNDAAPAKGVHTPFTFYAARGSFHGVAISDITAVGNSVTISNGTFKVTGGAGAYAGARGSGTFSGTGTLSSNQQITYKGTLTVRS